MQLSLLALQDKASAPPQWSPQGPSLRFHPRVSTHVWRLTPVLNENLGEGSLEIHALAVSTQTFHLRMFLVVLWLRL